MSYNDKQYSVYNGRKLTVEVFGASHAPEIGVKVDGISGKTFDKDRLQKFMDRRKPKKTAFSTKRLEGDVVIFESGLNGDVIDGELKAVIKNSQQRSADYDNVVKTPRPSHADFVAWSKYGNGFDHRGGGKFSGRLTAPMCIAGGIVKQILEKQGVEITAYLKSVGNAVGKGYDDIDQESFNYDGIDKDFPVIDNKDKEKMMAEI